MSDGSLIGVRWAPALHSPDLGTYLSSWSPGRYVRIAPVRQAHAIVGSGGRRITFPAAPHASTARLHERIRSLPFLVARD